MKRVWLVVGAVMMMLSGLAGFLYEGAKADSYNEADCMAYFQDMKASQGLKCKDIKNAYRDYEAKKSKIGNENAEFIKNAKINGKLSLNDYEKIMKFYRKIIYERSIENPINEEDLEICAKYIYVGDYEKCHHLKECYRANDHKGVCATIRKDLDPENTGWIKPEEAGEIDDYSLCLDKTGVLGWIICPVLTAMRSAIEWAYEQIEDFFAINPSFLKTEGKDSVYGAWKGFRDFGNIIFVILIMVIIFSQLTGIGISNYGIKKLLPKIIVVAILVNISYYLAQLAVDISNIIGYSAKSFLVSQVELSGSVVPSDRGLGSAVVGVVMVAIIGVGLALIFLSIPLLGAALLASLTMLAMLGLRQGLAITLVVMSPLALACFLLPNTKKIFDKYWAATKAVLIAFPLSGVMIGAGQVAGALTINASNGSEIMVIMGFLMYFAPFFAVPTMLKKSLDAIGGLGSKISGFGFGKAKKQFGKAGERGKGRISNAAGKAGAWAWTAKDKNGNVRLRKGAAAFSKFANKNATTRMLFGGMAANANKGAAAVQAKTAELQNNLNQALIEAQMTEANIKLKATLDENVIKDQLRNLQNQTDAKIGAAKERQANPEIYAYEREIEREKLSNSIAQANAVNESGMGDYFDVRKKLQENQVEVDIAKNENLRRHNWIINDMKTESMQKIQNETVDRVASSIASGTFELGGVKYSINNKPAIEALLHRTTSIVDPSGAVKPGDATTFKGIVQALSNSGTSSDFDILNNFVTGRSSSGALFAGVGSKVANSSMNALSEVISANKSNELGDKSLFDMAKQVMKDGGYNDAIHNFETKFSGQNLLDYDATTLGSQKESSLRLIENSITKKISEYNRLNGLTSRTVAEQAQLDSVEAELKHVKDKLADANSNQRITSNWKGEKSKIYSSIDRAIKTTGI